MKKVLTHLLPWLITAGALFVAFRGIDWGTLLDHIGSAHVPAILAAIGLTCCSYFLRARRWQLLFQERTLGYFRAVQVLILGFFMNNVLPARTGELVRAHMGSRITRETRTLVLATIASERLADGLTISILFVAFALHLGDETVSRNMLLVAGLFGVAAAGVIGALIVRRPLFALTDRLHRRYANRATSYLNDRFQVFVNGLAPLFSPSRIPVLILWSILIWAVELAVFVMVSEAYGANLPLPLCVLLLVAVNFSSLIPAAPGGIGVIEAVATTVLVSVGVNRELALTMVLTQHAIQYLVVGLPGLGILVTWRSTLRQISSEEHGHRPALES